MAMWRLMVQPLREEPLDALRIQARQVLRVATVNPKITVGFVLTFRNQPWAVRVFVPIGELVGG